MPNEGRKRISVKSSTKPMKKLKGFEEPITEVESSQEETPRKERCRTTKFVHCSQPVLGTPLKRKLHSILANWKPPTKKSQSTTSEKQSCNKEDEEENANGSASGGVVTDTDCTGERESTVSHTTCTPDIKTDPQTSTSHPECLIKCGDESPQKTMPLSLLVEGSGVNENKTKKWEDKSCEVNYEDLKSKHLIDIQNKEESKSSTQENLILEEKNCKTDNIVSCSIGLLQKETHEDWIRSSTGSVKDHQNDNNIDTKITQVTPHSLRQSQSDILVKTSIPSTEQDVAKLTVQSKENILDNTNNPKDIKLTSCSSQQSINNNDPSTCMPSFNDIVALDQDESVQEIDHGGCFVEENKVSYSGDKLIKERQSGKGKLILNLVDYSTSHDVRIHGNQQSIESLAKNKLPAPVLDDDLCISDSQFESMERNVVPKLSMPLSVPSLQNTWGTSSSSAASSSSTVFSNSYSTPFTPKMNHMQWVSQMKNDKRRLQGVVREISQLNAMLTRAIKEIWPTKK